jgi:hypothetical protein
MSYCRQEFENKFLVLGERNVWHRSKRCLWRTPFPLAGYQDVASLYPGLEDFFVRRLGVTKTSPSMLISEIMRMAEEAQPHLSDIRTRLIEVGMLLTKSTIDAKAAKALDALKDVKFLPKKLANGTSVLVGVKDAFAISDHERYGTAFAGQNVLLDFEVPEAHILDTMFQHLGLTHCYLSRTVKEVSTAGQGSVEDEGLSREMQPKAYALYW